MGADNQRLALNHPSLQLASCAAAGCSAPPASELPRTSRPAIYYAAVSGADPIETRAVRGPSGLDRGQRRAYRHRRGREPVCARANGPGAGYHSPDQPRGAVADGLGRLTASDDLTRKMRQIAGAFAEYEKARLVHKLRHARERQRKELGKCEGRKPHGELRPEAVALAKHSPGEPQDRQAHEPAQGRSRPRRGRSSQWGRGQPFNPKERARSMLDQK